MEAKKPFHETVAERLIEQLKEGTAPWQKPWEPGQSGSVIPTNPTTGKRYRGINAVHLMSQGRSDQRWMTYKQAEAVGAQVRKGEKGTPIQYWKFSDEQTKTDADGKPVLDTQGEPVKQSVKLERPRVFFATVFNAEQIDGLPPLQPRKQQEWTAIERAEQILQASGAVIRHGEQNRAFYRPATDSIHMPDKGQFPAADAYYAIALHELGHWTGHESRLGRDLSNPFGSEGYAKEELRAEIASMILGDELGIGHDPGQHAAYVGSWIKVLQDDPLEIFRAAADAEKIQTYVLALEQQQVQSLEQQTRPEAQAESVVSAPQQQEAEMQTPEQTANQAEVWMLKHVELGTVGRALEGASLTQIDRALEVLDRMQPMNTQNAFWTRHEMPDDLEPLEAKISDAMNYLVEERKPDATVAAARRDLATSNTDSREREQQAFHLASNDALGFALPHDWTGEVRVVGVVGRGHETRAADLTTETPEAYHLYARKGDAQYGEDAFAFLAATRERAEADKLSDRLGLIDANSQTDEYDKATRLARVQEERVRRDPRSTEEDITAAKEDRKTMEAKAFVLAEDAKSAQRAEGERRTTEQPAQSDHRASATATQQAAKKPIADRQFLNVPFKEKNEAKQLGARWDRQEQSWYVPGGIDANLFAKWAQGAVAAVADVPTATQTAQGVTQRRQTAPEREYLAVPYGERIAAKAAGAEWDKVAKSWYAGPKADAEKLARWKPENVPDQQGPAMTPQEEFADALRSIGCVVSGEHPIMDGKKHRISVEGEKPSEKAGSGFYVGHLDGHPAGYMKNNKTGIDMKWKSKGYTLDPEEKALLAAEAATKLQARDAEQAQAHEATAQRVSRQMADLTPVAQPTAYMHAKGIEPQAGVFTDRAGQKTYIPATDVDGKQWTMQYIQEDGTKRFAKDSRKEGCFHVVGGMDALAQAPALVIGEGYATAGSLSQSLGFATVAAFDSGNLPAVAKALHEKFPDKPVIIAGDDDRHLELTQGVNPGKAKAQEAAKITGGKAMLPIFAPGENSYPSDLSPVTPEKYREHQRTGTALSDEQIAALDRMKGKTDFNDLAKTSALGSEGIDRQVRTAVHDVIERHQARIEQQQQQQQRVQRHDQPLQPRRAAKL
jgi:putative DNA primase/helicase